MGAEGIAGALRVAADPEGAARTAAGEIAARAAAAVAARGSFSWVLSGGSTPRRLFELLAEEPALRGAFPWERTRFFWGDERYVPPDHPESNVGMSWKAMLSRVPAPPENLHRWRTELPPEEAAAAYEATLREVFGLAAGECPRFDLVLMGLGEDGHTASLFPGSAALAERERLAVAVWVEKLAAWRLTLTVPVFNRARCFLFLVAGAAKAEALRAARAPEGDPKRTPARLIQPEDGELLWIADRAAVAPPPAAG